LKAKSFFFNLPFAIIELEIIELDEILSGPVLDNLENFLKRIIVGIIKINIKYKGLSMIII
jgi:hypothetical protein